MNKRIVAKITGHILVLEAALMLLPLGVALYYKEDSHAFYTSILVTAFAGLLLGRIKPTSKTFYAKEGFAIVALSWVVMGLFGALPFYLSGHFPSYIDAVFETISGFTTTGASILTEIESLSHAVLFWRSFTHWIGGMGVLVLMMAVMPMGENSMHLMRAEVPGPTVGKFMPKLKDTAKVLYGIYLALTILEILLLVVGGMPLFDSAVHAFGSAGTGGFSIKNTSIAYYDSAYADMVIAIFMILFGVNFNLYFLLLLGKLRQALKSEELRCYLAIIAASTLAITLNLLPTYQTLWQSFRYAFFQVGSIITTTGYATTDFNLWPQLSRTILILLMFCGACAGSTGGGLKVSRLIIMWRSIRREISRMLHPRSVKILHMDGKVLDEQTINSVNIFFVLYMLIGGVTVLLISVDGFDFETNFTAMVACLNNIGPGMSMVGAVGNYSAFSDFSKIILSINMLLGRLEIFPLLLMLAPAGWKRGHHEKN